ncbi:hypothetical protein ES705_13748 [subsurface metagenome]
MAKERLSKLQRWILERCFEREDKEIWRNKILLFFGARWNPYIGEAQWFGNGKNKAEVSITNSLKNLFKKGYIDLAVGHLGGWYSLERSMEKIKKAEKDIKEIKETGEPKISKITGEVYDTKYIKERIVEIKKMIKEGDLRDTLMGHNIHRLKLTDKGIELAKSLNIN